MSAKKIRDEIMKMTIVVNSNPAQQEIYKLTEKNRELNEQLKDYREERKKIGSLHGRASQEYKDLTKKIEETTQAISKNKNAIRDLSESLDITDMSVKQLKEEYRKLYKELERTVPGSAQFNALNSRLNDVKLRLHEVRGGAKNTSMSFSQLADKFNHYSGVVTAVAGVLIGFGLSVKEVIDRNNKMADAMSGVMKTANLTKQEVEELMGTYSSFNTRTSTLDLLKISEVGGRLGVAKEELSDFTREVDKAYVALGDSWEGGVESLTDSLGVISKLYAETKDLPIADAINQVGSALNELAAQGTSSEQNIADFVKRMGSVPANLRPSLNTLLGFGSALEESGIKADIGASGFSKFIRVAAKDANKFAQVMGEPVDKVKALINADPSEFFLKFSEGLRGLDATELAAILDSLKLNDNEVIKIVGAASENTDRFRQSVELASTAVSEATSLQDEFNKVNNNAAGIYEKVQKKLAAAFTSKRVAEFLNDMILTFGKFIGVVEDSNGHITNFRNGLIFLIKILAIAITTTLSYNAGIALSKTTLAGLKAQLLGYTIVQKANNAVKSLGTLLQAAWNGAVGIGALVVGKLTGATNLQTIAQQRLNAVTKANPLGAILAVVGLLITAYIAFGRETDKVSEKQKLLNDLKAETKKRVIEEKEAVEQLFRIAKDETQSKETRLKAIKKLNAISPEYLGNLSLETIKTKEAANAVKEYVKQLDRRAMAEALQAKKIELYKKKYEIESEGTENYESSIGGLGKAIDKTFGYKTKMSADEANAIDKLNDTIEIEKKLSKYSKVTADAYWKRRKELEKSVELLDVITKKQTEFEKKNAKDIVTDTSDNIATSTYTAIERGASKSQSGKTSVRDKAKQEHKRLIEDTKRRYEESTQLEITLSNQLEEIKIGLMEEGFNKEMAKLKFNEKKRLAELEKQKVSESDFALIDEKIKTAKGDDKRLFEALKESWLSNNEHLEQIKMQVIKSFAEQEKGIKAKHQQDDIKLENKNHTRRLNDIKRSFNEELSSYRSFEELKAGLSNYYFGDELKRIRNWNDGKKALEKVYKIKELNELSNHLNKMKEAYQGLDLSILTKEQKDETLAKLEEVKDKLAEIAVKKQEIANGSTDELSSQTKLSNLGGNSDILGMNAEQWDELFNNLSLGTNAIDTMRGAIAMLQEAFNSYYGFVKAQEQAQLKQVESNAKQKEKKYKNMLNAGELNQKQYEEAIQMLNEETERKKAKLEYESAKRQKIIQVGQIIANTAQAIMSIWAQVPKFDFGATAGILTGVVSALGALQVATVLKTPLPTSPGYEDGFGMEYDIYREQDNKKFRAIRRPLKSGLVNRPTHFIAGENGVEMVIDSPTYTRFRPEVKEALHNEIARAKGFEGGYYPILGTQNETSSNQLLEQLLTENTAAMQSLLNKTFRAYLVKDLDLAKDIIEITEEYKELKDSSKR